MIRLYIQARMSSRRFPGKVLAPFRGTPIIRHVLEACWQVAKKEDVVILTSTEVSDDPLVAYLESMSVQVFRGPLENVFERFKLCLAKYPCEWMMRLNADSPFLDPSVLQRVMACKKEDYDLVTTAFPRTFPKGQNAELIRVSTFLGLNPDLMTKDELEHVVGFYYSNASQFRIFNIESENPESSETSMAVDSIDDLRRLELISPCQK